MKTKLQKIPGIMFTSFLLLLFFVGLGSFLNLKSSLENLIPTLEFNGQKALASENDIEEAQGIIPVTDDTMYVVSDSAFPGDTIWINVGLENKYRTAGFEFKLEVTDTSILVPWNLADIDTTIIMDSCIAWEGDSCIEWGEPYIDTMIIDTVFAIYADTAGRSSDIHWRYFYGGVWNNHLDTLKFIAGAIWFDAPDTPYTIISAGRGPVTKIKFIVNPDANPGDKCSINLLWGAALPTVYYDSLFNNTYVPTTQSGTFTVRSGGVVNHYPVFDDMPSHFEVNEGATLEFGVSATDPDGDNLTLYMDPLDPDYNYSFPTKEGVGSVTQTFSFTPTFIQGPATIYVTFKAEDEHGYVATNTVSIKIVETAQDVLIATSEQGGVPGSSGRMVPFIITNSIPIYGFQFTLRWDHTMVDIDSFVSTDVIEEFSLGENLGDSSGVVTVLVFGLAGQTIPAGIETVLYAAFSVEEDAPSGEVPLQLENAKEAVNPGYPSQPLGMVHGKFTVDLFGDANIDRVVDVADVVSVVAYILGNIDFTYRQFLAADVVPDSSVNVFDLGAIINIILGRWTGPSPSPYSDSEPPAIVRLDYEDLQPGATGEVKVLADLEVPVAGAQIQIGYDPEQLSFEAPRLSDWSDKFIAEYKDDKQGKLIVLLYNLANDPISPGEGNMLSLPVTVSPNIMNKIKLEIDEILLADENAVKIPVDDGKTSVPQAFELSQNYPNPFNPNTTIKYTLPSVGDGEETLSTTLKIYNILGEVVRTLVNEPKSAGVHYEVWDGKDDRGDQVASGIYFYRLKAGKFSETKKMVLLK
jgi:hypothetical protein